MATVSRALGGTQGVSAQTRLRVLAAADELGYVVSPAASNLARGATQRVAIVVPQLFYWMCAAMVEGLEVKLRQEGFDKLIYQVEDAAARHRFFADLPARRKVDAVVVVCLPVNLRNLRPEMAAGIAATARGSGTHLKSNEMPKRKADLCTSVSAALRTRRASWLTESSRWAGETRTHPSSR